jgi:Ca2+-binding RTX toxin-like protein
MPVVLVLALGVVGALTERAEALEIFTVGDALFITEDADPFAPIDSWQEANDVTAVQQGNVAGFQDAAAPITFDPSRCIASEGGVQPVLCDTTGLTAVLFLVDELDDLVTTDFALPTTICGGPGSDGLTSGSGADNVAGGSGYDIILGGPGNDHLQGEGIPGILECQAEVGALPSVNGLRGEEGNDLLLGGDNDDALDGGEGNDELFGLANADLLEGGAGEDHLVGLAGDDELKGGDGPDALGGGAGSDSLDGGAGNDELGAFMRGRVGDELQFSSPEDGNDIMDGGAGDDLLTGGPGAKPLDRGVVGDPIAPTATSNGADSLRGGDGFDEVSYVNRAAPVSATLDGAANDGLAGESDNVATDIETLTGGNGDDTFVAAAGPVTFNGGSGGDTLRGGPAGDKLNGGASDATPDDLQGMGGTDEINGETGADRLDGGDESDQLDGGPGPDTVAGGAGNDAQAGGPGDDTLLDGLGDDTLTGGEGLRDQLDYRSEQAPVTVKMDTLRNDGVAGRDLVISVEDVLGGAGRDVLSGDGTNNVLVGAGAEDRVSGGRGSDDLQGGAGPDLLLARDRARDKLRCGPARDLVIADPVDDVVEPARGTPCERVETGRRKRPNGGETLVSSQRCSAVARMPWMTNDFSVSLPISLPNGAWLDTRRCAATLTGGTQRKRSTGGAQVSGGGLLLRRIPGRRSRLVLKLSGEAFARCGRSRRVVRELKVRAREAVRVVGRASVTEAARASWSTADRCDGTLTRVSRGEVVLRGKPTRRLGSGASYLASVRNRRP